MTSANYHIEFDGHSGPSSAVLELPLSLLQLLTPHLFQEILLGKVDTRGADRVVLHLTLNPEKQLLVRQLITSWDEAQSGQAA